MGQWATEIHDCHASQLPSRTCLWWAANHSLLDFSSDHGHLTQSSCRGISVDPYSSSDLQNQEHYNTPGCPGQSCRGAWRSVQLTRIRIPEPRWRGSGSAAFTASPHDCSRLLLHDELEQSAANEWLKTTGMCFLSYNYGARKADICFAGPACRCRGMWFLYRFLSFPALVTAGIHWFIGT